MSIGGDPTAVNGASRPSLLASVLDTLAQGRAMVGELLELASLETRLAALSLLEMTAFAIGAALLGFSVWLLLLAAVAGGLIALGLSWPLALLLLAVLNGVGIWFSIRRVRQLSENLRFTATRNVLAPPQPAVATGLPTVETNYADANPAAATRH